MCNGAYTLHSNVYFPVLNILSLLDVSSNNYCIFSISTEQIVAVDNNHVELSTIVETQAKKLKGSSEL